MGEMVGLFDEPVPTSEPKQTSPITEVDSMTHTECVTHAATYLSKRCKVVLPEFYSYNNELPDVIGFTRGSQVREGRWLSGEYTMLVEVKVSRNDFLADKRKSFRQTPGKGMGDLRYYCCPKGLIKPEELPDNWGLLYVYPSGRVIMQKESGWHDKNLKCEFHLLYYYARRANYAGVHKAILDYRGFDS